MLYNPDVEKSLRQTGRTTRALRAAPPKALYVCCNANEVQNTQRQLTILGRTDLTICTINDLLTKELYKTNTVLVFDHAISLMVHNILLPPTE